MSSPNRASIGVALQSLSPFIYIYIIYIYIYKFFFINSECQFDLHLDLDLFLRTKICTYENLIIIRAH